MFQFSFFWTAIFAKANNRANSIPIRNTLWNLVYIRFLACTTWSRWGALSHTSLDCLWKLWDSYEYVKSLDNASRHLGVDHLSCGYFIQLQRMGQRRNIVERATAWNQCASGSENTNADAIIQPRDQVFFFKVRKINTEKVITHTTLYEHKKGVFTLL